MALQIEEYAKVEAGSAVDGRQAISFLKIKSELRHPNTLFPKFNGYRFMSLEVKRSLKQNTNTQI
jgi:hypothetical protein